MSHPLEDLLARARAMTAGGRQLLGIAGPPGSGKSVLARSLVDALGPGLARLVAMDGFHYAQVELRRLGRTERKGAPDTFDAAGFVALLTRLRAADEPVVHAPLFDRGFEEPIGSAVPVPVEVPLVVVEGNYLLLDAPPWDRVRPLLHRCWYVAVDDALRQRRLVERHRAYGRDLRAALERTHGSDERNALLVAGSRTRADLVVDPQHRDGLDPRT